MHGIDAHKRQLGLRTPFSALVSPCFVVTSSAIEHLRTEHPLFVYLLSPILEVSEVQNSTICLTISFCVSADAVTRGRGPRPASLACTCVGRADTLWRSLASRICSLGPVTEFLSLLYKLLPLDVASHLPDFRPDTFGSVRALSPSYDSIPYSFPFGVIR